MNSSCPICFDLFDGHDVVATPCGHVFHSRCIFQWIDTSKVCPECRNAVTKKDVIKLHLKTNSNASFLLDPTVINDLDTKEAELTAKQAELTAAQKKMEEFEKHCENAEQQCVSILRKNSALQVKLKNSVARERLESFKARRKVRKFIIKVDNLQKKNFTLKNNLKKFNYLHNLLQGTQEEAEAILHEFGDLLSQETGRETAKAMANLVHILQLEVFSLREQKEEYKNNENELTLQLELKNAKIKKLLKAKLKKLLKSQTDLQNRLKIPNSSPRPVMCLSNNIESANRNQVDPIAALKYEENSAVSPISEKQRSRGQL